MKKILLVDDEEQLIGIMASVLQDEGFAVKKMFSAEEALNTIQGYAPDLVISDVGMGKMDGFTLYERIRKLKGSNQVPFIFLTAMDDRLGQQKASKLGATAFFSKPFDVDELVSIVKKVLLPI